MNNSIKGKVYVLEDNVDTDQIIPAEYLVYSMTDIEESKKYGRYALSGVPINEAGLPNGNIRFISNNNFNSEYNIIIAGENFGCGSSREHAPFALQKAGVKVIIAQSFARIFYRNVVDGGFLIPFESSQKLIDKIKTDEMIEILFDKNIIINRTNNEKYGLHPLGDILPIIEAGGLFKYAKKIGQL
jgi:3-isopropylmalate/(R)-2-methylmalate dehydratase small subunit